MIENNIQVKDDVKAEEFVQEGKSLIFVGNGLHNTYNW